MDPVRTERSPSFLFLSIALVAGLFLLGQQLHRGIAEFEERDRVVTVKGLAEREVDADVAIWPLRFVDAGDDYSTLYRALEQKTARIVTFLHEAGFADDDVTVSPPAVVDKLAQRYGNPRDASLRYTASRTITVYTGDVDRVRDTMTRLEELGREGIVFETDQHQARPQFLFTGLNEIKPAMIEEATLSAREVARKFAEHSQSRVGRIRRARQGQFTITDRDASTPHVKKVRVVSTIDYHLAD